MEAAANLHEDLPAGVPRMSRLAYLATLQTRLGKEKAHQKELAKAAEIGSETHGYVEWTLRRERGEAVGPEPRISDKALWAFMVWQDWQASVKLRPLAIEQVVRSTTYRFAGALDFLAEITLPGHAVPVYVVGDIKTGKAIYDEARLQVSAYSAALREMEHAPPGVWAAVVRLPKSETDPDVEIRLISPAEQEALFQTFLHVQALWNWQQAELAARGAAKERAR
jgi:predicted RecB family nuclease